MNVVWNARKTAEAIERRKRGETLKQIADALGTSVTPVFQNLRKHKIARGPSAKRTYVQWTLDMDEKLMMMRDQKMTQQKTADAIGVCIKTMKRRCRELGI